MSWQPLAERLHSLPLILAGPMVRRVDPSSVTVWLALKQRRRVTLHVYQQEADGQLQQVMSSVQSTLRLGDHLHLVTVTARCNQPGEFLQWGQSYFYDLTFAADTIITEEQSKEPQIQEMGLADAGILTTDPNDPDPLRLVRYPGQPLPSFILPAQDLQQVRIIHGSCRRPHAPGKETLSVLDTLIESALSKETIRPQQLFLTGDQIYADNVAAALLLMLIDAGDCLLAGNEEEILPLLNVPARLLAPTLRSTSVHDKAMFTTTTPQNHLLAFAEFCAMYLFCWSDVLWPGELPTAPELWQLYPEAYPYTSHLKHEQRRYTTDERQLEEFRSALPAVRRALANIATYMISDDHEITDDWYLDGAWCQRVLASKLGYQVVRNAHLAYALFQACGNTPEQFVQPEGQRFLEAVEVWSSNADGDATRTMEEILGMPKQFSGSGELQRSQHALHWHYTYTAARYQVIVLDTRNHRYYQTPHDFPALLSPTAIQTQIQAVLRSDVEITVIISPAPVLGVDLMESIQFWSRWRIKDNYAFDREAWALQSSTFHQLLRTVSAAKSAIFLSGDVHYAFGSSMEYWDHHTQQTARFINFTSSPLYNEESGSQIAVLAVGYPRLQKLMRRNEEKPSIDFLAWDLSHKQPDFLHYLVAIIRKQLYRFWWSIPRLVATQRSPDEIVLPAKGWLKGVFNAFPPDRSYRVHYLRNSLYPIPTPATPLPGRHRRSLIENIAWWYTLPARLVLQGITLVGSLINALRHKVQHRTERITAHVPEKLQKPAQKLTREAIERTEVFERQLERRRTGLIDFILHYSTWLERWKAGELIVGYNNIGEITFRAEQQPTVVQRLWWYQYEEGEQPLKSTEYTETLTPPPYKDAPALP